MKPFALGLSAVLFASAARMWIMGNVYTTLQGGIFAAAVAVNLLMYALAALDHRA